jgi:hypothetical protein
MKKITNLIVAIGVSFVLFTAIAQAQSPEWVKIKEIALRGTASETDPHILNGFKYHGMTGVDQCWFGYNKAEKKVSIMLSGPKTTFITYYNEKTKTFWGSLNDDKRQISWDAGIKAGKAFIEDTKNGHCDMDSPIF